MASRRNHYSLEHKQFFISALMNCQWDKAAAYNSIITFPGFRQLPRSTFYCIVHQFELRNTIVNHDKSKPGKKVNEEFESMVLQRLMTISPEGIVTSSMAYSYGSIRQAAIVIRERDFAENEQLQKLAFSNMWVT